jgi:hypothetical protein
MQTARLVLGTSAFAEHAVMMANANPSGFRTPSVKPGRPYVRDLVVRASLAAGLVEEKDVTGSETSDRGLAKRRARVRHRMTVDEQKAKGFESSAVRRMLGLARMPSNVTPVQRKLRGIADEMAKAGERVTVGRLMEALA